MSTNAIVGLVVAVVVVGVAVWYYTNNSSAEIPVQGVETGMQGNETTANNGTGSLASLFAMTGSYRCAISSSASDSATDGVVYISNGNVRGDFTSSASAEGQTVEAHMIKSGDTVYVWSDAMPQGMKMNAAVMMGGSSSGNSGFDPNVSVNYSCELMPANASLFVAPANIQFMAL